MANTILVVDDERQLVSFIESYLAQEGFHVLTASNGIEALSVTRNKKPDLIILDLMMPEMDGYEFMRIHRREADTPIILLTARVEDDEKVIGLELGADDYLTKPFHPRELAARVRTILRRTKKLEPAQRILQIAGITLDREMYTVQLEDRFISLTPTEFNLLAAFMSAPGKALTRLELLNEVQELPYAGYERTIDTHIKNLRLKLEDNSNSRRFIETVYGIGYRFVRA